MAESVGVSGVWLYNEVDDDYVNGPARWVVAVEVNGLWRRCIVESADGPTSHIVEPSGIRNAPLDARVYETGS